MLAAMAQHPDDRPASVEDFRRMLRTPIQIESPAERSSVEPMGQTDWIEALRAHRLLVTAALLLTMAAVLVTLWSPNLPGAPR